MAMRALETERIASVRSCSTIRQADILAAPKDDMEGFMDTFDHNITVSAERWEVWAVRNGVEQHKVMGGHSGMREMLAYIL